MVARSHCCPLGSSLGHLEILSGDGGRGLDRISIQIKVVSFGKKYVLVLYLPGENRYRTYDSTDKEGILKVSKDRFLLATNLYRNCR